MVHPLGLPSSITRFVHRTNATRNEGDTQRVPSGARPRSETTAASQRMPLPCPRPRSRDSYTVRTRLGNDGRLTTAPAPVPRSAITPLVHCTSATRKRRPPRNGSRSRAQVRDHAPRTLYERDSETTAASRRLPLPCPRPQSRASYTVRTRLETTAASHGARPVRVRDPRFVHRTNTTRDDGAAQRSAPVDVRDSALRTLYAHDVAAAIAARLTA
jgi:hypothetical protein